MTVLVEHEGFRFDSVEACFAGLLVGSDTAVAALEHDGRGAERLAAYVSDPRRAADLARTARPDPLAGDHPARLLLHALARQYKYDGNSPELGGDLLEALDGCLARDATAWADIAAEVWFAWLMHEAEPAEGWRMARAVLDRHADRSLPPRLLASFAAMSERAGAVDVAAPLWERARGHEDVAAVASIRWGVEFEWARSHLLLSGGAPVRALQVLERAHAGLARFADERGRFAYVAATLELAFVATLVGRVDRALTAVERTRAAVSRTPEYEPWLAGVEAFAFAVSGCFDAAGRALGTVSRAETDTSSLQLVATIPASLLVHASRNDRDGIRADIEIAREREAERVAEVEMRVAWRIFAALALRTTGLDEDARSIVEELQGQFGSSPVPLPAYEPFAQLVAAIVRDDRAAEQRAVADLGRLGVRLVAGARDPWGLVDRVDVAARSAQKLAVGVRIEVLGGLRVLVDGAEVTSAAWSGRRKAQALLAVLVASGNRMDRLTLVDGLWDDESLPPSTADARMWTLLSKIRSVLGASSTSETIPTNRCLVTGPGAIQLQLATEDSADVVELRDIALRLAAADPRRVDHLEHLATTLEPLVGGTPLDGVGTERIVLDWRQRLVDEVVDVATRLGRAWLTATREDQPVRTPPEELIEVARHAARLDPLAESAALVLVELLARAGRGRDASRAFHRHRMMLDAELGMHPSRELVRIHAAAVELDGSGV